jgi:hypothetical protein
MMFVVCMYVNRPMKSKNYKIEKLSKYGLLFFIKKGNFLLSIVFDFKSEVTMIEPRDGYTHIFSVFPHKNAAIKP